MPPPPDKARQERPVSRKVSPSPSLAKVVKVKSDISPDVVTDPDVPTVLSPHEEIINTPSVGKTPPRSTGTPVNHPSTTSDDAVTDDQEKNAPESISEVSKPVLDAEKPSESNDVNEKSSDEKTEVVDSTDNEKESETETELVEQDEEPVTDHIKVADSAPTEVTPAVEPGETPEQGESDTEVKKSTSSWISGKSITPQHIDGKPKKKRIFWTAVLLWFFSLVTASAVIGAWGYTMWVDAEADKRANQAYEDGARDIVGDPSFDSVVRMSDDDFDSLVSDHPGKDIPDGYRIDDRTLVGWSIPGGTEYEGRANVEICWTSTDIDGHRSSRIYMVSEDAQNREPTWIIDAVTNTGESCEPGSAPTTTTTTENQGE